MNQLEAQVQKILQNDNWEILPNAYYKDPDKQIPREKDLIATCHQFASNTMLNYSVRLFIECKNIPEKSVLDQTNVSIKDVKNVILDYGIPFANIEEIEERENIHFIDYPEIYNSKDSGDHIHKAVNQNLQSFSAFRKSNSENALYYLIIVFDGELQISGKPERKNALIKIETLDDVFNLPNKKCLIELVHISEFDNLLKKIRNDIQIINESAVFYYRINENEIEEKRRRIQSSRNRCI